MSKNYTPELIARIADLFLTKTSRETAELLGVSIGGVVKTWRKLGLRRADSPLPAHSRKPIENGERVRPRRVDLPKYCNELWQDLRQDKDYSPDFEPYIPVELLPSQRPGANDHEQWPSIMGGYRVWRDGRRERIKNE